jgi:hypothetical protein
VLSADGWIGASLWRLTLWVFVLTGGVVALVEWDLFFREALLVGAPAIVATLLVDTFLYNEFLIRTGSGFWLILYAFLFVQSAVVAASIHYLSRYWSKHEREAPK